MHSYEILIIFKHLIGATTLYQSGLGSNGSEGVLHTFSSSDAVSIQTSIWNIISHRTLTKIVNQNSVSFYISEMRYHVHYLHSLGMSLDLTNTFINCTICPSIPSEGSRELSEGKLTGDNW